MSARLEVRLEKWYSPIPAARKCGTLCLILVFSTLCMILLLSFITYPNGLKNPIQILYIESEKPSTFKTHQKYLSVGLDSVIIANGFENFNVTNKKLIKMMKYLAPGYLRIGGNLADKLYFSVNSEIDVNIQNFYRKSYNESYSDYRLLPNYTMTGAQWLQLAKLAENVNMNIFFDLNSLIRFQNGSWDYRNAKSLIEFSNKHALNVNWELGNEPNSFKHKFGEVVNATQMAKDFVTLRAMLNKIPRYKKSFLVGPDVTRPQEAHKESILYLEEFLRTSSGHSIDAITWHQYYFNGRTARPEDFLNPDIFDWLKLQIEKVKEIVNTSHIVKPIYLGETASAYGGGAPNLSDSFIGSFIWADKLGLAAKMGVKVVMRQSIFHGYYALLDENYNPNPDWWISLLHKKLVGQTVIPYYTKTLPNVRLYVHCSKKTLFGGKKNSITIIGMNLSNTIAKIKIKGLFSQKTNDNLKVFIFEFTSLGSLLSKQILFNGKPLKMLPDNKLPLLVPKLKNLTPYVTMSPFSIVFWVIPNTNVKSCSYE